MTSFVPICCGGPIKKVCWPNELRERGSTRQFCFAASQYIALLSSLIRWIIRGAKGLTNLAYGNEDWAAIFLSTGAGFQSQSTGVFLGSKSILCVPRGNLHVFYSADSKTHFFTPQPLSFH